MSRSRSGPARARRGLRAPERKPRLLTLFVALSGAALIAACGAREPVWGVQPEDSGRILLEVYNDNFQDARVFARWNGERQRLGLVIGNSSDRFEIPGRVGTLRIEVDFIAGGSFLSDPVNVGPGENLVFRIPPQR